MNLEALAWASGASFFARATVNHTAALVALIERALAVPGFSMVEIVSNCHVLYGRMNDLGDAAQMMQGMEPTTRRVNPVLLRRAAMPQRLGAPEAPVDDSDTPFTDDPRIQRGVIFERPLRDDYAQRYHAMVAAHQATP